MLVLKCLDLTSSVSFQFATGYHYFENERTCFRKNSCLDSRVKIWFAGEQYRRKSASTTARIELFCDAVATMTRALCTQSIQLAHSNVEGSCG